MVIICLDPNLNNYILDDLELVVTIVPLLFLTLFGKRGILLFSPVPLYCGYFVPSHFH